MIRVIRYTARLLQLATLLWAGLAICLAAAHQWDHALAAAGLAIALHASAHHLQRRARREELIEARLAQLPDAELSPAERAAFDEITSRYNHGTTT
ncbi:hypothetical protein ACH4UM_18830 [Streptomyces sp. NPDC020801]|uniref:hypothetical protein n=1 Tax=Streptomyces sp. NPDC020801 TaxID=3365093 RepID=UPI00379D4CDB